jgi:pSer/pThr/pTyr-binding forkhead associated (FHA) protein
MERSSKPMPTPDLALRFIAGKYKGKELPLKQGNEIILGRVGEVDVMLAEDMVSRRHARVVPQGDHVLIEDLESTNGTFVNGEKIRRTVLKEGDRILIGTNILKVVAVDSVASSAGYSVEPLPPGNALEQTRGGGVTMPDFNVTVQPGQARPDESPSSVRSRAGTTGQGSRSMSGAIHEFPLPYLLQLLESSQKNGVLVIRSEETDDVAKLYLRKGNIVYGSINDIEDVPPLKSVFRILAWTRGTFDLEPPIDRTFPIEIDATIQEILMEGMRQLDELNNLRPRMPEQNARLILPRPLKPRLRDLGPVELDTLQLALNFGVVIAVMDRSPATDFETARALLRLIEAGYLRVG